MALHVYSHEQCYATPSANTATTRMLAVLCRFRMSCLNNFAATLWQPRCDTIRVALKGLPIPLPSPASAFARLLLGAFCLISVAGCTAQAPAGTALTQGQERRIELLVRSQLSVPADWDVVPGSRTASDVPGFDTLHVVFSPAANPSRKEPIDFLLSKDGKTLAKFTKYDLEKVPGLDIAVAGRPVRGSETAKVEIVNFDDLECPFCARMHAELFPQTLDHYKGLVKVVYKDDPLMEIHPWALRAAVDANCLAAQNGKAYWNYVDYVHAHGEDVSGPDHNLPKANAMLDKIAMDEGARSALNKPTLAACLTRQDETAVRASAKEAEALHVDGTPALFIDGERVSGAQPVAYLWAVIDRALRAQGITPPPEPAAAPAATAPGGTR